jgi:hypothetical protein
MRGAALSKVSAKLIKLGLVQDQGKGGDAGLAPRRRRARLRAQTHRLRFRAGVAPLAGKLFETAGMG